MNRATKQADAERWARVGLEPEQAAVAHRLGFRAGDIERLRRSTPNELDWPEIERRLRATADAVRARAAKRFTSWIAEGNTVAEAIAWLDAGFQLSAAWGWRARGFPTPQHAQPWRAEGYTAEAAERWTHTGVQHPAQVRELLRRRITADALWDITRYGVPLDVALDWLDRGFAPSAIPGWYELGFTPEQVRELGQARSLGHERLRYLLARGVPFATIVNLSTLTGLTWAEIDDGDLIAVIDMIPPTHRGTDPLRS
ncbi:MAG: hypothetical protein R2713_12530 [Ilumatobacteraceae bacterium]